MTTPSKATAAGNRPAEAPDSELHHWLGAIPLGGDRTRFCLWAPRCHGIAVEFPGSGRRVPLEPVAGGFHLAEIDGTPVGTRYFYRVGDGPPRPDPASRYQPTGVHGPSEVVTRSFSWTDQRWRGVPTEELLIYEIHIGTFTERGTFLAAIDRLDELIDLGVTAVELMPVADSAGRWNWGYDGVDLFAPRRTYGTPDDLRQFVDAAHHKGLAVILDVVYNHFGPEGNYLGEFGSYLSTRHNTVWGDAPNFDDTQVGPGLRRFIIANAIHWYDEYHFDALRIDAIHCMMDDRDPHVVEEISRAAREWTSGSGRRAMLIAESNIYDPELLSPLGQGGYGFDAEWCDDFLHSVYTTVRPGEQLTDRRYDGGDDLARTLQSGFVYAGTLRESRQRKDPRSRVDTHGLIYCIQNHDFIGNHPLGQRLHQLTSRETQRAAAALLMLTPAVPMLFMGEEFACEQPFLFFVDFGDEPLRRAVVEGRRAEYPQHDWSEGVSPIRREAFERSRIGPSDSGSADRAMRRWYQSLIKLRRRWRSAGLLRDEHLKVTADTESALFTLRYEDGRGGGLAAIRLCRDEIAGDPCDLEVPAGYRLILDSRAEEPDGPQAEGPWPLGPNHARIFELSDGD